MQWTLSPVTQLGVSAVRNHLLSVTACANFYVTGNVAGVFAPASPQTRDALSYDVVTSVRSPGNRDFQLHL